MKERTGNMQAQERKMTYQEYIRWLREEGYWDEAERIELRRSDGYEKYLDKMGKSS